MFFADLKRFIAITSFLAFWFANTSTAQALFEYDDGSPCTLHEISAELNEITRLDSLCRGLPELDSCLIGHWVLDHGSYVHELTRLLAGKEGITIQNAGLAAEMLINDGGIVRACLEGLVLGRVDSRGVTGFVEITMRGRSLSHIGQETASGFEDTICVNPIADELISEAKLTIAGNTTVNTITPPSLFFPVGSKATCRGDILTVVTYPEGVDFVEHVFHRK